MNIYLKKALHYLAGNLFNKILLIVFLPIFTAFLIPEEYALYTNYLIFIAFAGLFYLSGLTQSLFSYFYKEDTQQYRYTLINSILRTVIFVGLIISVVIVLFRDRFTIWITGSSETSSAMIFIVLIIFFEAIYTITLSIVNIMERSEIYAGLGAVKNIVLLVLFVFGAILNQFGLEQILWYMLVSAGISGILSAFVLSKILREFQTEMAKRFSWEIMKPVLRFGIIMIPGTLGFLTLRVADRYMLTHFSEGALYDVGIYAVGYRIGMIMQFLVSAVSLVYFPYAMKTADTEKAKASFRKIYNYFLLFGAMLGTLVILFSNEIFRVFIDAKYFSAVSIVFVGVISVFLHGVFNIINLGFYVRQKAGKIAIAVVSGAVINIVLNYFLIPKYGIIGAGTASILAYIYIVLLNFVAVRKVFVTNYSLWNLTASLLVLGLVSYLNFVLPAGLVVTLIKALAAVVILVVISLVLKKKTKPGFMTELLRKK